MTIDWRIEVLGSVESTQIPVFEKAQKGEPEGYVLQALIQTGGKGRHGKTWHSPMGNLYTSLLLRPDCTMDIVPQLSFVVALALSDAIGLYIDPEMHQKTLKWPNDILINSLKISGILLETSQKNDSVDCVVIGTGVNIFAPPEGAIGLKDIAAGDVFIHIFRDNYLEKLSHYYEMWQRDGFASIRSMWLDQAHGVGEAITVNYASHTQTGIFEDIDAMGNLLLKNQEGTQIISSGEVHFGDKHASGH